MLEVYSLAYALHKTVGEILQIPASELEGWREFFALRDEEMKKAARRHG